MSKQPRQRRRSRRIPVMALTALVVVALVPPRGASAAEAPRQLLVRCDDVGMCHAADQAVRKVIAEGIPLSTSVMFACPWYLEAVAMLAKHPEVSVGVHLTLNSEWESYRWGPVLGASRVPSLVDANGYFLASEEAFAARAVDLREVEAELRAQISRALASGLRVDYLDAHMHTAFSTPALRALVLALAREYRLGISTYLGERSATLWDVSPDDKLAALLRFVREASPGLTLLVIHPGLDDAEMRALVDTNNPEDPFRVGRHRQAEVDALTSPAFRAVVASTGLQLVTYREVIARLGLGAMAPPEEDAGYTVDLKTP